MHFREKHDLEGKIMNLQDLLERSGDEEQVRIVVQYILYSKLIGGKAQEGLEEDKGFA